MAWKEADQRQRGQLHSRRSHLEKGAFSGAVHDAHFKQVGRGLAPPGRCHRATGAGEPGSGSASDRTGGRAVLQERPRRTPRRTGFHRDAEQPTPRNEQKRRRRFHGHRADLFDIGRTLLSALPTPASSHRILKSRPGEKGLHPSWEYNTWKGRHSILPGGRSPPCFITKMFTGWPDQAAAHDFDELMAAARWQKTPPEPDRADQLGSRQGAGVVEKQVRHDGGTSRQDQVRTVAEQLRQRRHRAH
jgi:hypothetical protein